MKHRMNPRSTRFWLASLAGSVLLVALGCAPRVMLEAPREPIVIHLNVKIDHEVRVKVEQDLEEQFRKNEEIF